MRAHKDTVSWLKGLNGKRAETDPLVVEMAGWRWELGFSPAHMPCSTLSFFLSLIPQWGTADAEIKIPPLVGGSQGLSNSKVPSFFKPGVGI